MTLPSRRVVVALVAIAGFALGTVPPATGDPASASGVPRSPAAEARLSALTELTAERLLVRWHPDASARERAALLRRVGAARVHDLGAASVLRVGNARRLAAVERRLADEPLVTAVERDRVVRAATADPGYPYQWALENTGQEVLGRRGRAGVDARFASAWQYTRGGSGVVVALVDSGVDIEHPDLGENVWRNPGEQADGTDTDGNGFVDDLHGWDFVHDDASVYDHPDGDSHGTELAGLVAAIADNRIGIAGAAPDVRVLPVKFLEGGAGAMSDGLAAIRYAVAQGADVIVASWVGDNHVTLLQDAIEDAGVLVVGPAGNDGRDLDVGAASYPASYTIPNLLSVAAIDNRGGLADFSNRGSRHVDLAAPGVDMVTTDTDERYAYVSGTSMAAAVTGAAAALALSVDPRIPAPVLADLIRRSSRPYVTVADATIAGGLLDAHALLGLVAARAEPGACADPPPNGFHDVSRHSVHVTAIDCLVFRGTAQGRTATEYDPHGSVTRAAMATFLARVLEAADRVPQDPEDAFLDDDGSVHEANIDIVAAAGIVEGVAPGTFAPGEVVTRAQMATMLRRTYEAVLGDAGSASRSWFDDDETPHDASIDVMRDLGVLAGAAPRQFDPATGVRRDQMASFLTALLDVLAREGAVTPL